ncbi:hypothetical protein O181_027570 [Austropuccinia psidii MF-1]|uniref:Uncharacterized protein n=1 Tax=Austropuccinia psidii MF-1 TaxID=1389203 RepID=A0A9Q3H3C4_9BASI|nr:hypothetical protein [Austropuccinia psidii MF-1]
MMHRLDLDKPQKPPIQTPSILILDTTPPPEAKPGPSKHQRMVSPEDPEPMVNPFGDLNTPQAEAYPGSSKKPHMASDEDLDQYQRCSPNGDSLNQQSLYT